MRNLNEIILTNSSAVNVIRNIAGMDHDYTRQRDCFMQEAEKIIIIEDGDDFKALVPGLDLGFLDDNVIMDQVGMDVLENYNNDTQIHIQIDNTSCAEYAAIYTSEESKYVAVRDEKFNDLTYILPDAA